MARGAFGSTRSRPERIAPGSDVCNLLADTGKNGTQSGQTGAGDGNAHLQRGPQHGG